MGQLRNHTRKHEGRSRGQTSPTTPSTRAAPCQVAGVEVRRGSSFRSDWVPGIVAEVGLAAVSAVRLGPKMESPRRMPPVSLDRHSQATTLAPGLADSATKPLHVRRSKTPLYEPHHHQGLFDPDDGTRPDPRFPGCWIPPSRQALFVPVDGVRRLSAFYNHAGSLTCQVLHRRESVLRKGPIGSKFVYFPFDFADFHS